MDLDGGGNFPFYFLVDKQGLEPAYAATRDCPTPAPAGAEKSLGDCATCGLISAIKITELKK
jgi:hypothetical protein